MKENGNNFAELRACLEELTVIANVLARELQEQLDALDDDDDEEAAQ